MEKTLIITTGGTIESFYNPEEGTPATVPQNPQSCIPDAIEELKRRGVIADVAYDHYPLGQHDSKKVTREQLQHIAYYLSEHPEYRNAIIVHGTDTMPVHGRLMEKYLREFGIEDRKVVFTGAMEPLRDEHKAWRMASDGWDNLAFTLTEIDNAPKGVHMVMEPDKWMDAEYFNKHVETKEATPGTAVMVEESGFVKRDPRTENIPLTPLG